MVENKRDRIYSWNEASFCDIFLKIENHALHIDTPDAKKNFVCHPLLAAILLK